MVPRPACGPRGGAYWTCRQARRRPTAEVRVGTTTPSRPPITTLSAAAGAGAGVMDAQCVGAVVGAVWAVDTGYGGTAWAAGNMADVAGRPAVVVGGGPDGDGAAARVSVAPAGHGGTMKATVDVSVLAHRCNGGGWGGGRWGCWGGAAAGQLGGLHPRPVAHFQISSRDHPPRRRPSGSRRRGGAGGAWRRRRRADRGCWRCGGGDGHALGGAEPCVGGRRRGRQCRKWPAEWRAVSSMARGCVPAPGADLSPAGSRPGRPPPSLRRCRRRHPPCRHRSGSWPRRGGGGGSRRRRRDAGGRRRWSDCGHACGGGGNGGAGGWRGGWLWRPWPGGARARGGPIPRRSPPRHRWRCCQHTPRPRRWRWLRWGEAAACGRRTPRRRLLRHRQ